jgi:CRISPR/Cas system endoribonuclease Cas6 (RAMP superfamily)
MNGTNPQGSVLPGKATIERKLFFLTSPILPAKDYRRAGLVVIKGLIQKAFPKLYDRWYEAEEKEKKPFTFQVNFKGKRAGDFIILEKPFTVQVSGEENFLNAIQEAFYSLKKTEIPLKIGDAYTVLSPVGMKTIKIPVSSRVKFSDLLIPYEDKGFLSKYGELPLFQQFIYYFEDNNLNIKDVLFFRTKTVYHRFKGELYKFTAIETEIEIEVDEKRLIELYRFGMGWHRSAGFGFPVPVISNYRT